MDLKATSALLFGSIERLVFPTGLQVVRDVDLERNRFAAVRLYL
jgi:hypothetical protein